MSAKRVQYDTGVKIMKRRPTKIAAAGPTLTDFRVIQEHLAQARERGYAWDRGETVPGGICDRGSHPCAQRRGHGGD